MPEVTPSGGKFELRPLWTVETNEHPTAIESNGTFVAVGTGEGAVHVYRLSDGALCWKEKLHPQGVQSLSWAPGKDSLATCGQDRSPRIVEGSTGSILRTLEVPASWCERITWSPTGRILACASGKILRFWNSDGSPCNETPPHRSTILALAWSPDGTEIAAACYGGVQFWSPERARGERCLEWKGSLLSLAWSPDGKVLASGSQDCSVHFWRLHSGRDSEMTGFPAKPKALAWDANSSMLATGGDQDVTVWNFAGKGPEGSTPVVLNGHQAVVAELAFHPRKALLLSGALDCGIIVWEPRKSNRPARYAFLREPIAHVRWTPSGENFLACDTSGQLALFKNPLA